MRRNFIITDDGSSSIYIPELNETYHSTHGAIRESIHVFINSGFKHYIDKYNPSILNILEVGLGTGLNLLLTLLESKKNHTTVNYTCIEPYPLNKSEVKRLNYSQLISEKNNLDIKKVENIFNKIHESIFYNWFQIDNNFNILKIKDKLQNYSYPTNLLLYGDLTPAYNDNYDQFSTNKYNLIYYDAFAPSKQPEMWDFQILSKIKGLLFENGVLVTYCAQGQFRKNLRNLDMYIERLKGPPGKAHMTRATLL